MKRTKRETLNDCLNLLKEQHNALYDAYRTLEVNSDAEARNLAHRDKLCGWMREVRTKISRLERRQMRGAV